jgi:hypothetical protein
MMTTAVAGPGRSAAVAAVGWLTVAWGVAYAVAGVSLLLDAPEAARVERVRSHGWGWLVDVAVVILYGIGVASLLLGALGVAAGAGVLSRRRRGRLLAFWAAALALLFGVLWVWLGELDAIDLGLGLGQVLYGATVIVVLAKNGAEFPRPDRAGE